MAACALYFDRSGKILIVNPTYRNDWLLPGGIIEADESPFDGCRREVLEELGKPFPVNRLLCVEYQQAHGDRTESLQFMFTGGILTAKEVAAISLQKEELSEFRYADRDEWSTLLNPFLARRIPFGLRALREGSTLYIENGFPIG